MCSFCFVIFIFDSKEKHNTLCVGHHHTQTNTNKTRTLIQTTGGKDKPNIIFIRKS